MVALFINFQIRGSKYLTYERLTREDSLTALKDFTKQEIRVIMEINSRINFRVFAY